MISKTKLKEKIRRKSNPDKIQLVHFLKKQSPFWIKISAYLAKPKRSAISVNLSKINKVAKDNAVVLVPGKILSDGELKKTITISSFSISEQARQKIGKSKYISIEDLAKKNKGGEGIIVLI